MSHQNSEGSHQESETTVKKKRSIFSYLKWIPIIMLTLVCLLALFVIIRFRNDASIPYDVSTEGVSIPKYTEIELPMSHNYVKALSLIHI